ncbi:antibiotic biosynthesis monooxygenase [Pseudonocardia acidicola]|uniref:Antibiotic biosynthesis monooxygenase n=1 Tax=Pseudonocardia acidicola TaxID=2724939 RepID=A0ABX1SAA1_9PSEU|nr:antibiotic biosynthesis monooxygenase [Pseudonocardia acidicola]NMH97108.1 antibiotic biosynthesis monooxygenase [Pseudonocardia acidicola]
MTTVSGPTSARAHRLADDEPVTVVFSWRAKPGKEEEFARWAKGLASAAAHFPGNLGATVIHEKGSRDFHIIEQFVNRQALQRWLNSDERARLHQMVRDIADARTAVQQRTGLETWFYVPSHAEETIKPPPRWKQWLVSLIAVYPLVLLFQAFVVPRLAGWPLWARAAMFPLIILTLMTYVVMPIVSRLLRRWLYRGY